MHVQLPILNVKPLTFDNAVVSKLSAVFPGESQGDVSRWLIRALTKLRARSRLTEAIFSYIW